MPAGTRSRTARKPGPDGTAAAAIIAKRGGSPGWRPRAKMPASARPAGPPGTSRATGPSPAAARTQRHMPPQRRPRHARSSPSGKNTGSRADRRPPMSTRIPRRGPYRRAAARQAGARLCRLAAVLAGLTCALLAPTAVPAAFATTFPDGGLLAVGVATTATAQQPDKPGSPATASPCSEVCSGGGYASGTSTTTPAAYSLPMILPGAGTPGPCSEVCSGGGYGRGGPPSRTPGDSKRRQHREGSAPGTRRHR